MLDTIDNAVTPETTTETPTEATPNEGVTPAPAEQEEMLPKSQVSKIVSGRINEIKSQYQDYDTYKDLVAQLSEMSGKDAKTMLADLKAARETEAAQKRNLDPEVYREMEQLKQELSTVKQTEQQRQLETYLNTQLSEVQKLAAEKGLQFDKDAVLQAAAKYGMTDLKAAFRLSQPEPDLKAIRENAIKEYLAEKRKADIPVEGSGGSTPTVATTPRTFEDARKAAIEMMRAAKQQ